MDKSNDCNMQIRSKPPLSIEKAKNIIYILQSKVKLQIGKGGKERGEGKRKGEGRGRWKDKGLFHE